MKKDQVTATPQDFNPTTKNKVNVVIPYVQIELEQIKRVLGQHGASAACKPYHTL